MGKCGIGRVESRTVGNSGSRSDKLPFLLAANLDMFSLMSFLDNLESALKNMESREERDPGARKRRDSERASVLAAAPSAEKLKNSSYIQEVLKSPAPLGYQTPSKIPPARRH